MTDYERVRAILDAATPGPWTHRLNHKPYRIVVFGGKKAYDEGYTTADINAADARAIVVARNLAPELLAVAEAAEDYVDLFARMNYPATAAMYPQRIADALDALHAKMKETLPDG